jgi:S-adenosylmethionine:tRNA ribosyltransferase-isomerase
VIGGARGAWRVDPLAPAPATAVEPAPAPSHPGRADRRDVRLLAIDTAHGRLLDRAIADLPGLLATGDLIVLNDAATLPASLAGRAPSGAPIEVRLAGPPAGSSHDGELGDGAAAWPAVLLGPGDWHTRTEDRAPPDRLAVGDVVELGPADAALRARVTAVSPRSPRLVDLCFDLVGAPLYAALYRIGRPVQYAHQDHDLALWTVQTSYAGPPWAVEMPSAGRPLSWQLLAALRRRGVELAWLTHAAGLSATGDPALDALLPLPERYRVPAATADAVHRTRAAGRRVIAVGTTVVRALEGAARDGRWAGGTGTTDLVIEPGARLAAVDGLLSGIHGPSESHYRLLGAFAPLALLDAAWRRAQGGGYLQHELGDLCLIAPGLDQADQAA